MPILLEKPKNVLPISSAYYVGNICIDPPVVLAPMADVTNGSFRRLVKRMGSPGLVVTELISTAAIHYGSKRTFEMFDVTEEQRPLAVQLFGADPAMMAEAAKVAVDQGADIIDINMGCWVPKVCKTGAGAAMMKDEAAACRIVEAIVRAVEVPVTVKTRAGWQYGQFATVGLAKKLEEAGVQAFALHARYATQGHTGEADWELIRQMKESVSKPVVGNGDIKTPQDALRILQETGCDGVMIGRAAIGNPWVIRDIVHYLKTGELLPPPTLDERIETALAHVSDLVEHLGENRGVRHLRGQLPLYFKGYRGSARLRDAITSADTLVSVRDTLARFANYIDHFEHGEDSPFEN